MVFGIVWWLYLALAGLFLDDLDTSDIIVILNNLGNKGLENTDLRIIDRQTTNYDDLFLY